MTKIFKVPFAATGDKTPVPDAVQSDGSVSYAQGYGFDYERPTDGTDPLAKVFPRRQYNAVMNDVTGAVGEIQLNGAPIWQSAGAPYPINAKVRYLDKNWISTISNNNDEPGTSSAWTDTASLTSGRLTRIVTFEATGTLTLQANESFAEFDAQGAGGQGGGSPAGNATQLGYGTGGHSGSRMVGVIDLTGLSSLAITIGAGGSTGLAGAAGQAGGTTSIGSYVTCPGGAGGGPVGPTSGPTYIANSAAYPVPSSSGPVTVISSQQGNAGYGGIAFSGGIAVSGIGAASPGYGGNVSGNIGTGTGSPGTQKGQGGSGGFSSINAAAQRGGSGASGKVTLRIYSK